MKGLFDMDEDTIVIPPEDVEVIDASEYKEASITSTSSGGSN